MGWTQGDEPIRPIPVEIQLDARKVEFGSPLFHDGSVRTLAEAVDVMFRYQLGRSAPPQDQDSP